MSIAAALLLAALAFAAGAAMPFTAQVANQDQRVVRAFEQQTAALRDIARSTQHLARCK